MYVLEVSGDLEISIRLGKASPVLSFGPTKRDFILCSAATGGYP